MYFLLKCRVCSFSQSISLLNMPLERKPTSNVLPLHIEHWKATPKHQPQKELASFKEVALFSARAPPPYCWCRVFGSFVLFCLSHQVCYIARGYIEGSSMSFFTPFFEQLVTIFSVSFNFFRSVLMMQTIWKNMQSLPSGWRLSENKINETRFWIKYVGGKNESGLAKTKTHISVFLLDLTRRM